VIEATCSHTVAEVTVVSKHRVNNVSQVDPVFRSSFGGKHEQGSKRFHWASVRSLEYATT